MKSKLLLTIGLLFCFLIFAASVDTQTGKAGNKPAAEKTSRRTEPPGAALIVDFSGPGTDEIFPAGGGWQAFGPYRTITVRDNQKIVGTGAAVFGTTSGIGRISVGLCYRKNGNPALLPLAGDNHLNADVGASRQTFSVTATGTLPAGTYAVGYCVANGSQQTIDNNNYVNGWVMVVD